MKVDVIGIGELGVAVANNMLKAGHDLVVYDTRPETVANFVSRGAKAAESAAALAAEVSAVITALPTPPVVQDVLSVLRSGTATLAAELSSRVQQELDL